jgi:hypothetical protein
MTDCRRETFLHTVATTYSTRLCSNDKHDRKRTVTVYNVYWPACGVLVGR